MTEKEFRKLVSEQEVTKIQKEKIQEKFDYIKNILDKHHDYYKLVDYFKAGSFAKGTMLNSNNSYDMVVVVEPIVKKVFSLTNKVITNEIINAIICEIPEITKSSDIKFDELKNVITFKLGEDTINIIVYYNDVNGIEDLPTIYLSENEKKRIQFVELANRDYTYFRNAVQIIKYYRDEQKINQISGYIIEVLLYYSLREYCFDTRYEDYLNAFLKGLDDFIGGKKIEVYDRMYQELNVTKQEIAKKGFMVMDVATGTINLSEDVNEIKIGDYRKLKKTISKLVDTKSVKDLGTGPVKLNVTPIKNNDGTYSWNYKIEDTTINGGGGNYTNSDEDTYTAIYKAMLKGLKAIIDNNLNRKQVEIISPKVDALTNDKGLSNENNARRKNVLAFIENNQIKITK